MEDKDKFLYKDLSYQIVGCFYDVYNELGPAHKEQVYHEALKVAFENIKLKYKSKPKIKVFYKSIDVGTYEPDFIVENKIIIELKSVQSLPKVFEVQLYYYIKATDYKVGYLVNFGSEQIDIRRKIYDLVRK